MYRPPGTAGTLRALRRSGDEFAVEIGLSPVRVASECFVVAAIVDITLRKLAGDHQRMFEFGHATLAACQQLGMPAAVLQRDGRIMSLNPLMADLRSQLRVAGDRFEFANPAKHDQLLKALASLDHDASEQKTHQIPVHTGSDRPPLVFHLMAIKAPLGDVIAVLVVTMLDSTSIPSTDLVQGLFSLAPAEARIAVAMSAGLSPRQAAIQLGISEGNVRTALKRIFAKTGVSRQSELAALLARLRLH